MTRSTRAGSEGQPRLGRVTGAVLASVLVTAAGLSLSACSGDDTADDTPGGTVTSGPAATASSGDPATVLGAYHLTLPAGAQSVAVQEKPHDTYTERYLVTFTAPAADVEALCEAAGLPSTPAVALRADQADLLGTATPPAQARICQGSDPSDPTRQRAVLFVGDPAQVWVMTWRMPAR